MDDRKRGGAALLLLCLIIAACSTPLKPVEADEACQSVVGLNWTDCGLRAELAAAPACAPSARAFRIVGRLPNFDRAVAVVCCAGRSCSVAEVKSAEPSAPSAAGALLVREMR